MNNGNRVYALAAGGGKTTTVKAKAEAAKEKARESAKRPGASTAEKDEKQLAKGKALRK